MRVEFDTTCPACERDAKVPADVEGEDVVACGACGEQLEVKADVGTDVVTGWLVTVASERAYFAALRSAESSAQELHPEATPLNPRSWE